jgi:hypothetical protein
MMPRKKPKRALDIEKLLHWAYRDELSKRHTSSAEGIWDRVKENAQRGGVDPGHGAAQRYPHFGLPHPDAEAIEKAVSALPDLILDWSASCDALVGDMGGIIGKRDILMVRSLRTAALVTMHAGMGTRPDWCAETPKPGPVASKQDPSRPALIGECRGRNLYTAGSYCPIEYDPSPLSIAVDRAEYCAWHRGLVTLATALDLEDHIALSPGAPEMPWRGEREAPQKIWAVGERPRQERFYPLNPARGAPVRRPPQSKHGSVRKISAWKDFACFGVGRLTTQ